MNKTSKENKGTRSYYFKIALWTLLLIVLVSGVVIYATFDPANTPFPKCSFKQLTGLSCPGCGSQRAIHQLLHLNIGKAIQYNPLFIITIPYLMLLILLEIFKFGNNPTVLRIKQIASGQAVVLTFVAIVVIYTISRNIFNF